MEKSDTYKALNGRELAGFIKERQAKEVRRLKQADGISPKLAIIQTKDDPIINTYVGLKQRYGSDIGVIVEVHHPTSGDAVNVINTLNADTSVHGMIVQLPLDEPAHTERVINSVAADKDVDGLAQETNFDPATPTAILWLLSGYNIDLTGKNIVVAGVGPLVGAPLVRMLEQSGHKPTIVNSKTQDLVGTFQKADVIVSATGKPGLIRKNMIKSGAIVLDAGTAVADGKTVGDLDPDVYQRTDLTVTPPKGGIGPLTVCSLFDNVLKAARKTKDTS